MKKLLLLIAVVTTMLVSCSKKDDQTGSNPATSGHYYQSDMSLPTDVVANIEKTKADMAVSKKAKTDTLYKFLKQVNFADDDIPYCKFLFSKTAAASNYIAIEYHFTNSIGSQGTKGAFMLFADVIIKGVPYTGVGQIDNCPDECELGAMPGTTVSVNFYSSDGAVALGSDSFKVKPIN